VLDFCLAIKKAFFPVGYFFNLPNSWPCNLIVINPLHLHSPLHLNQLQTMRIQFGAIVVAGAGKAGGTIIQRGRTGQVLRNLTKPISRTDFSSQRPRALLANVSSSWRFITNSERISWNSLAATLTRYNKFGVSYIPNGYQIFCEFNLNRVIYFGDEILSVAPTLNSFPNLIDWVFSALPTGPAVTLTWDYLTGDVDWYVFISFYPLQSMGASVPRGSARQELITALITAETLDLSAVFTSRFGTVPGGVYQVAIEVNVIQLSTGQRAPALTFLVPFSTP